MLFVSLSVVLAFVQAVIAASRTSPPSGALVVRAGTSTSGEYKTVQAAVNALPSDSSSRSIFIYPGTYTEQVYITRPGPLTIYGYTDDTSSYSSNQVTIQFNKGRDVAASNDETGTLRIHKDDFKIYNVNLKNTRGAGTQAGAISQYGNRVGFYACGFYGYQDTLYANAGTQVYLKSYIQGKTDFIYGRQGRAYFGGNTIAVSGPGYITASGRQSDDAGSYVFNSNTVVQASGAESGTSGGYYFGRPWDVYAKVIFKNTVLNVAPNKALWTLWNGDSNSVSHAFLADYKTSGSGASGLARASFARQLSDSEANSYTISSAVGSDYANWVDMLYFV
ncbi:carbohydrate esterase family 8 protein [Moniliophthora roreri MCA 2997]|uniref:pectinesterase n=1 Tax=Moniliophthora roreri (strain MCA 2997) TaxID=1381753 RepID=V2W6M2_MONRO|nr:carbohydrate esterase family 8 protein [Moniliophthora roreri MCA 2997]